MCYDFDDPEDCRDWIDCGAAFLFWSLILTVLTFGTFALFILL